MNKQTNKYITRAAKIVRLKNIKIISSDISCSRNTFGTMCSSSMKFHFVVSLISLKEKKISFHTTKPEHNKPSQR